MNSADSGSVDRLDLVLDREDAFALLLALNYGAAFSHLLGTDRRGTLSQLPNTLRQALEDAVFFVLNESSNQGDAEAWGDAHSRLSAAANRLREHVFAWLAGKELAP